MEQPELLKEEGSLFLGCARRDWVATWPLRRNLHMCLWYSFDPSLPHLACPCPVPLHLELAFPSTCTVCPTHLPSFPHFLPTFPPSPTISSRDPPSPLGGRGYSSHFKDEEMDTQRLEFLAPSQFSNCELIIYCVPGSIPQSES